MNNYVLSFDDLTLTRDWEQCRLVAYKPVPSDPWTVGWGCTGPSITEGTVWSQAHANDQLVLRANQAGDVVRKYVRVALTLDQFIALVDFVYNVGETQFAASTLLKRVNSQQWDAADAEFLRWNMSAEHVLLGLTRRRDSEKALFILGTDYSAVAPVSP